MVHRIAEPAPLRQACDKESSIRALYDPIGAKASDAGAMAAGACAVLYVIADFYLFGWRQSIVFVAAILCITALRRLFWVGLIALFILGKVLGVPVGGGTFLSLLIEFVCAALAGAVGGGIVYGITHLIGKLRRWDTRAVVWRGMEATLPNHNVSD